MEASDSLYYMRGFANSPQGGRCILINEVLGTLFLRAAGIAAPEAGYIQIDRELHCWYSSRMGRIRC
jgi:hypothetical protein